MARHRAETGRRPRLRRPRPLVVVSACSLTCGAAVLALTVGPVHLGSAEAAGSLPRPPNASASAAASASSERSALHAALHAAPAAASMTAAVAAPTSVQIPAIGVDSSLVRLGTQADGTLAVPTSYTTAGWFTGGPAPGEVGPAVIAGHLDSKAGPGVFARLSQLTPGAQVVVHRADGSSATFVVTALEQVAKASFPTSEVYGPVAGPELRIITCGGAFDRSTGHYVDNVLVYARLV